MAKSTRHFHGYMIKNSEDEGSCVTSEKTIKVDGKEKVRRQFVCKFLVTDEIIAGENYPLQDEVIATVYFNMDYNETEWFRKSRDTMVRKLGWNNNIDNPVFDDAAYKDGVKLDLVPSKDGKYENWYVGSNMMEMSPETKADTQRHLDALAKEEKRSAPAMLPPPPPSRKKSSDEKPQETTSDTATVANVAQTSSVEATDEKPATVAETETKTTQKVKKGSPRKLPPISKTESEKTSTEKTPGTLDEAWGVWCDATNDEPLVDDWKGALDIVSKQAGRSVDKFIPADWNEVAKLATLKEKTTDEEGKPY